jgi:hypothetical protein
MGSFTNKSYCSLYKRRRKYSWLGQNNRYPFFITVSTWGFPSGISWKIIYILFGIPQSEKNGFRSQKNGKRDYNSPLRTKINIQQRMFLLKEQE